MSNMIYKYNQSGVAKSIQLGKRGGQVTWDTDNERFQFTNSAGTNPVLVSPLTPAEYESSTTTKIEDNSLVTAGYVKSLVQGMRTKRAVQTATTTEVEDKNYFNPDASPIMWDDANKSITTAILGATAYRTLFGFGDAIYAATTTNNANDPAIVRLREVWTKGTRILLKNQSRKWQNGIYEFALNAAKNRLYLVRADDMDVEDEAEGAYVYVEQGTLGNTGWVGTIPGSPATILDPRAPKLKAITVTPDNFTQADDQAAGYTPITFEQFHGQGTINGDALRAISIDTNKVGLDFSGVGRADSDAARTLIVREGRIVIEVDDGAGKSFLTHNLATMLHNDFNLRPYRIRDSRAIDTPCEIRVSEDYGEGSEIIFSVPSTDAAFQARPNVLRVSADKYSLDFGGRETGTLGTAAKGATIAMTAGGTDSANGAGGDIVLRAGNASQIANTASAGNIVLSAGFEGTAQKGTVNVEGSALRLPVGNNDARPETTNWGGAIRLNNQLEKDLNTLEYYNGKDWVQLDGASYFIHDKTDYDNGETAFDTFISTMGETVVGGTVAATPTNALTFVAHSQQVMHAKEDEVTITPQGTVKLSPTAGKVAGHVVIETPSATEGATKSSSGNVTVSTGENTTTTDTGSHSGKIALKTGDHKYGSGDIELSTGAVRGTGTSVSPIVGSVYISTGEQTNADGTIGTVYVGKAKTGHVKNNVVVGDGGTTVKTTIDGKAVVVGSTKDTTNINIGTKGATVADSSGDVAIYGKNVSIAADDTADATNANGVKVTGRNIDIGTANTTTNITVGHITDTGITGTAVEVRGSAVNIISDNSLQFTSTRDGQNVVFSTNVKEDPTGVFSGGVLMVSDSHYHEACGAPSAIPNVKYVQNMIKDGRFGPGTRMARVTQAGAAATQMVFPIGTALPAGARITRISITVNSGFDWAADGGYVSIRAADVTGLTDTALTDRAKIGDELMGAADSDIEVSLGAHSDIQTYMSEFGAGIDAPNKTVFAVFPTGFSPNSATQGDLRVLVEFVADPPADVVPTPPVAS